LKLNNLIELRSSFIDWSWSGDPDTFFDQVFHDFRTSPFLDQNDIVTLFQDFYDAAPRCQNPVSAP